MTKQKLTEKNFKKQIENIKRKQQVRQKFLTATFQEISDIEIILELAKRVRERPTIKLSTHPNQDYISIEGKDGSYTLISYLPIEIIRKRPITWQKNSKDKLKKN